MQPIWLRLHFPILYFYSKIKIQQPAPQYSRNLKSHSWMIKVKSYKTDFPLPFIKFRVVSTVLLHMWKLILLLVMKNDFFRSFSQIPMVESGLCPTNMQQLKCINIPHLANVTAWNVMHSLLPSSLYYISLLIVPVLTNS
jgi:hypothetical protein